MPTVDKRVDQYIKKSSDFARPILFHFRKIVHKSCPQVQETIKWGFPHFDYMGTMCSMAAFKGHCAVTFWKASLMKDKQLIINAKSEKAMGHLGRITSLKDLPSDKKLTEYILEAMKLNKEGIKISAKTKVSGVQKKLVIPDYFMKILEKNKRALKTFNNISTSHKREYIDWIVEAKREDTRKRRISLTKQLLADGKSLHWKYQKKNKS